MIFEETAPIGRENEFEALADAGQRHSAEEQQRVKKQRRREADVKRPKKRLGPANERNEHQQPREQQTDDGWRVHGECRVEVFRHWVGGIRTFLYI